MTGWDLSELNGCRIEQQPPWSYLDLAREALIGANRALDLGTGGGEVLLRLVGALPRDNVATEGWVPNIAVATQNLSSHGISVVPYDAESDPSLPFEDDQFDVVLDRHEAYVASEVFRVLHPGGRFLTQQVDGRDFEETQAIFGGQSGYPDVTLAHLRVWMPCAEVHAAVMLVPRRSSWVGQLGANRT